MPAICQHCKEEAFDEEDQVCTSCGIVSESIQLCNERFVPGASHNCLQRTARDPQGLKFGKSALTTLCTKLKIRNDIREQAMTLLMSVHSKYNFYRQEDIAAMAACCLSSVNKKEKNFISISSMSLHSGCPKTSLYKFSRILKTMFGDDGSSSEEETFNHSESWYPHVRTILCNFPVESRNEVIDKTVKLLALASSCWLLAGRPRDGFVVAAAYMCWKSIHPRLKHLAMKTFCSEYGLQCNGLRAKVKELTDFLLKLGCKIPAAIDNYVTKDNVLFHLNYILENSETLRNDLVGPEYNLDTIVKKEFDTFRKPPKKKKRYSTYVPNSIVMQDDFKSFSDFSDPDISDSEINSYIRTEEQVNFVRSLKEEINSDKE